MRRIYLECPSCDTRTRYFDPDKAKQALSAHAQATGHFSAQVVESWTPTRRPPVQLAR